MKKLIKIEHEEKGVWYFTSYNKASSYIGCALNSVRAVALGHCHTCKGWTIENVEDDGNIPRYFINPSDGDANTELKDLISRLEQAIAIMREWEKKNNI